MRILVAALALLVLGACSGRIVPAVPPSALPPPPPPPPSAPARAPVAAVPISPVPVQAVAGAATALAAGLVAGPNIDDLPISRAAAARALDAFRLSCPDLIRRADVSGMTRGDDWRDVCERALRVDRDDALRFFRHHFETVQVGEGRAFATGYFEPEIAGSRVRAPGYEVPIYAKPADLIDFPAPVDTPDGKVRRGRIEGGTPVAYYDRTAIEQGALDGRGLEIAWAADPVELFFLQIQGSGRLRMPDGSVMRIGYAGQNGREYVSIGAKMRERGLFQPGQATMQGIMAWLRANPDAGRDLMRENKSYVFFRELTGPGPLGALGRPVAPQTSVAADPNFIPLGAPVFLSMDRIDATGLWVAQDTGGAIKGANRFDTFWGAGPDARAIAGGMSSRGTAFVLLPKGTLRRLTGR